MDNKSLPIQTDKDSKVKLPENYTTTDPTEKLAIDLINGKEVQWVSFSNTDGIAIDFIIVSLITNFLNSKMMVFF